MRRIRGWGIRVGVVVLLDACVLYPAPLRDLLMHLAVLGLFQARWTEEIHEEWIRNLLNKRPDLSRDKLERTSASSNKSFHLALPPIQRHCDRREPKDKAF